MLINFVIAFVFLAAWIVFYVMMMNYTKPKKNIIIGVTLPHSAHDDPETKNICKSYKKWLNIVMLPLLLLAIPPYFLQFMGITMLWFMTWLLVVVVLPMVVFAKHRSRLIALKREKNWHSEAAGRALVDVKAAAIMEESLQKTAKKINPLLFLPPVIAGLFSIIYSIIQKMEFGIVFSGIVMTLLIIMLWLFYYLIFRVRTEVVNEDATLTVALTRIRRYNWGRFFLIASWLTGINLILPWLFLNNMENLPFLTLGYAVLMIGIALWTEFDTRIAQQKLTAKDTGNLYLDEDDHWLLGLFYHNPNDNHFLVNDRVGMNMSVNLAKPAGKIVMILVALIIMALPFLGIWMWSQEVTPPKIILEQNTLIARHTSDEYVITLNSIESSELLEIFPSMIRTFGTGLPNLYKGSFRAELYGPIRVCTRPNNPPFLIIKTDGNTYLIRAS